MYTLKLDGPKGERLEVDWTDENEVGPAMERLGRLLRMHGWDRGFAVIASAMIRENERRERTAANNTKR